MNRRKFLTWLSALPMVGWAFTQTKADTVQDDFNPLTTFGKLKVGDYFIPAPPYDPYMSPFVVFVRVKTHERGASCGGYRFIQWPDEPVIRVHRSSFDSPIASVAFTT